MLVRLILMRMAWRVNDTEAHFIYSKLPRTEYRSDGVSFTSHSAQTRE